jgi:hypothetical protein
MIRSRLAELLGIERWRRAATLARNAIDDRHLR